MFDLQKFLASAEAALAAGERIAEATAELGVPYVSPAAKIAASLIDLVQYLIDRAQDAELALTTEDTAELKALVARLNAMAEAGEAAADAAERAALAE